MLEVSVRCGEKKGGDEVESGNSEGRVVEMSLVMMSWRGCEGGGTSQRDEPGIFDSQDVPSSSEYGDSRHYEMLVCNMS